MKSQLPEDWFDNSWQARLDQQLDLLDDFEVLAILAPPGFGKKRTLDRWRRLLTASGKSVCSLDASAPQSHSGFSPYSREAAETFLQANPDGGILIVDNLHHLDDRNLEALVELLSDMPNGFGAILSAVDLDMKWLMPLVAGGQLRILDEALLSLTLTETAERVKRFSGADLQGPALRHLFAITAGWPIAVECAAEHISQATQPLEESLRLLGIWPSIEAWIRDNIWSTLDAMEHSFLLELSVLTESLDDHALIASLTGVEDVSHLIERLTRRTSFFRYDGEGRTALSPIGMAFLVTVAERPAQYRKLHSNAARILISRHHHHAIGHALAAGEMEHAVKLIDEMLAELAASGEGRIAKQWLSQISLDLLRSPSTIYALGMLGDATAVRTCLEAQGIDGPASSGLTDEHLVILAMLATLDDDPDKVASLLQRISGSRPLPALLDTALRNLARWLAQQSGEVELFVSNSLPSDDARRHAGNFGFRCSTGFRDGEALLDLGQATAAIRVLQPMQALAENRLGRDANATLQLTAALAAAHRQSGREEEARQLLTHWGEAELDGINPSALQMGYITAARLAAAENGFSDALRYLTILSDQAQSRGLHKVHAQAQAEAGRIAIMGGRAMLALQAERALRTIIDASAALGPIRQDLTRLSALLGLAQMASWLRQWDNARLWLTEADEIARRRGRAYDRLMIAELLAHCGGAQPASPLERARDLSIDEADAGVLQADMAVLYKSPAAHASIKPKAAPHSAEPGVILTLKEREVLELMARGFTKQRIAEMLTVSGETIKWHQKNIYAKFDVGDRHNVLKSAEALGFL
ncbi:MULTISPECIES: helix-turn-helix transcriptional regulator [unclassified Sphingomonas]|uniref:helix-turn-helix transcriptional regulator n=1 Tax=unclassified Sphingomonas TaxID=196159 RepID=UPI0006F68C10|nr:MULTISPECIES: LuxR C-terminal-related transcriptional regulator [unclassified Sphingomonas]KQX18580.1 hypothetical protein ASD17_15665 [Sphingomonas sp. Root1294]KQY72096.1 hypothetical protein ASD39_19310 [Sphingomonas sp. Root50]KRB94634.1 hypothetical protein ASE22_01445 [Sphingomonas sp. Root720]